ncbi:hypothetical protein IJ732_05705 [bacterium]|nr:hypothetical protein [bacterium]
MKDYSQEAIFAVNEIKNRAGKNGQFLNWVGILPENQLKNIDNIYEMAEKAKIGGFTDIAVLGIGGSRHTTEAMMKLLGKDAHVHFYSSIDPESFKRFANSLDLDKTKFLVVSKSGGTLETTIAYENAKKLLTEKYPNTDLSERFVAMTDKSPEKSKLRRAVEAGEIKLSGLVHDDVGGRFSILDDATLFTMAFAGVSKDDAVAVLEASIAAQKEFLNPVIEENEALRLATFNVDAKLNGKKNHFVEYFGDAFSGVTLWEKQMKNESLKSNISTDTNVGPGYLHYNAESDLDPANTDSFFTFVYVRTDDLATNALMKGAMTAYKNQHPVTEIVFNDLSPKSIGRFIELKHFETLYTGIILRQVTGGKVEDGSALPEVLQPNVEIYKKEVKKLYQY